MVLKQTISITLDHESKIKRQTKYNNGKYMNTNLDSKFECKTVTIFKNYFTCKYGKYMKTNLDSKFENGN